MTTTIKKYKTYLTVTHDPNLRPGNYIIYIHDLITGQVLGQNVVQMHPDCFDDFESYAFNCYETYCPVLNRDVVITKSLATHNISFDTLDIISSAFKLQQASFNKSEQSYRNTIVGSSPDSLQYWIDLQVGHYRLTLSHLASKKALDDISKIKSQGYGELSLSFPLLYACDLFDIGATIHPDKFTNRLNYPLADALNAEKYHTITKIKYPHKSTQSFYKDTVSFIVEKREVIPHKKLTDEQLLPKLPAIRRDLNSFVHCLFETKSSLLAHPDEIFYGLHTKKLDRYAFTRTFTLFNTIKNMYMLIGQEEEEATYNAIKQNEILSNVDSCKIFNSCIVTGQFLPRLFLTPYKDGYISTFYAFIHSETQTVNGARKYELKDGNAELIVDAPIEGQADYEISVFGHDRNAMQYLSVRKQDKENTTITCEDSLYKPTPFMGIELEVQQQDKVLYEMPDGKGKYAPDNVVNQVYEAIGKDYVILKRDGSLRGKNPFEIVTVPATLAYHKTRWKSFLENAELKRYLTSYSSGNCGMHVHINRASFTGLHLAKFMHFINCQTNFEFITSVAQRAHNKYAEYLTNLKSTGGFAKYFKGNPDKASRGSEKYMAVNTKPSETIEVRIFRGNLAKIGFLKNLEFVHAVWAFTKDAPLTNLTFKDFMFWLFNPKNNTKDYKELKMWLLASGWNIDGVVIRKTDTKLVRQHKEERRSQIINARKLIRNKFDVENMPIDKQAKLPQELRLTKAEIISAA